MKNCTKCGIAKPLEEFPRKSSRKDGRGSACKICHRKYTRRHYQKNKQYYKDKAKRVQDEIREFIRESKHMKPCADCGVAYPYYVMHFDHQYDKRFNLNEATRHTSSLKTVKAEIAKCEIVCANCHSERSWGPSSIGKSASLRSSVM